VQLDNVSGPSLDGDVAEWHRFIEHLPETASAIQSAVADEDYACHDDDPLTFNYGAAFDDLINGTSYVLPFKLSEEISDDGGKIMLRCTLVRPGFQDKALDGSASMVCFVPSMHFAGIACILGDDIVMRLLQPLTKDFKRIGCNTEQRRRRWHGRRW
jgi:hypothetical protein